MNRKEALLAESIIENWEYGLGKNIFDLCSLPDIQTKLRKNIRFPATDIAWREFDLLSDPFMLSGRNTRLVFELKNGGIGYRTIAQVLFYKHIFAPKHQDLLGSQTLIFIAIGSSPNLKRWSGKGNLESDAEEFLKLFKADYWPDENVFVLSHEQIGLRYDEKKVSWLWIKNNGQI